MGKVTARKDVELHKIKGCDGCNRSCLYNRSTATKEVAEKYKEKFQCNSSHPTFDKEKI